MQILCIGDSNTWGYNPENGLQHKNRWTRILAERMPEDEIIEEGMCGRTLLSVDSFDASWCGIEALPGIIAAHRTADVVILMLGTNELKSDFGGGAAYIAKGIERFLEMLQTLHSWEGEHIPQLLVVSPILLGDDIVGKGGICADFDETSLEQSKLMAKAISKVCEKYNVEFMDGAEYAKASLKDAIHMDEKNHEKLGKAIYNKLQEMLEC